MNTTLMMRKDGTVFVYHWSNGGATKFEHSREEPCDSCPEEWRKHGKRPAAGLPDVRHPGE